MPMRNSQQKANHMTGKRTTLPCFLLLLVGFAVPLSANQAQRYISPKDRIVIVISIDGLPGWEWQDRRLPVPHLWKLANEGVRAKSAATTFPTVTWPSHTSMVTGVPPAQHGVLFNGLPVRGGDRSPLTIKQWHPKEELVQAPTVYDLIFKAGLTTAEVDWVAIHQAKNITWRFPEIPDPNGAVEREMIAGGVISETDVREFFKSSPVWRDQYWTEAAVHIIKRHKPNLLLFHLLNVDANNHLHGARTWASKTAYAYADECVGKVLDALNSAGLSDRATILVVSDHGFKSVKRFVRANAILRRLGLLAVENGKTECDAYALGSGGSTMVYITNSARRRELVSKLADVFRGTEGVGQVLLPEDFAKWDLPDPAKNDRMADLVLVAGDGYAFHGSPDGPEIGGPETGYPGHHGYAASDPDMNTTFLAWGYAIQPGAVLDRVSMLDVAPTLAALLGIEMKDVKGRVLHEMLVTEQLKKR